MKWNWFQLSFSLRVLIMSKFVRPLSLELPTTYHEFSSNKDKAVKFKVQDLEEKHYEKAIEMLRQYYMPEETFSLAKKMNDDDETREILSEVFGEMLKRNLSVGCFCVGSNELVAVNVVETTSNDEEEMPEITNKSFNEIVELMVFAEKQFNPCNTFEVDTVLTSYALCVHPSYRGLGIATEVLKARVEMLKAFNLTVTSTMFTTLGSQIAAEKAGYEESWSMTFAELQKKFPSFDFSQTEATHLKKFSLKI